MPDRERRRRGFFSIDMHPDMFLRHLFLDVNTSGSLLLQEETLDAAVRFESLDWARELLQFRSGSRDCLRPVAEGFVCHDSSSPDTVEALTNRLLRREAVLLASRWKDIRTWNDRCIAQLDKSTEKVFVAADSWSDVSLYGEMDFSCLHKNVSPRVLRLRLGARVKLTQSVGALAKNQEGIVETLDAKSVGVRIGEDLCVLTATVQKSSVAGCSVFRQQLPLILSCAQTWMSVQGSTFRNCCVICSMESDLIYSHGQLYVVLSRGTKRENCEFVFAGPAPERVPNVVVKDFMMGPEYHFHSLFEDTGRGEAAGSPPDGPNGASADESQHNWDYSEDDIDDRWANL